MCACVYMSALQEKAPESRLAERLSRFTRQRPDTAVLCPDAWPWHRLGRRLDLNLLYLRSVFRVVLNVIWNV